MPETFLKIPQIGEGLQEARLVAVLKSPGDNVKRDEPIYQIETDKAVMDVESPFDGTIVKWLAEPDTVLKIGADVLVLETGSAGAQAAAQTKAPEPVTAAQGASVITLKIPQIGEGLQEARLVAFLKNAGDTVQRDEAIYQMETDKAVMDVESPYAGKIVRWLAEPDTVLAIGADLVELEVAGQVSTVAVVSAPASSPAQLQSSGAANRLGSGRRRDVSPRVRAYARSRGLSNDVIETVPATGTKLSESDIDAFMSGSPSTPAATAVTKNEYYSELPMGQKQRLLMSRLTRGSQLVVPGTMTVAMDWGPIEALRAEFKASGGDFQPSVFTMFAYAAAKATANHPMFRSTIVGEGVVRTYHHVNMGIAVTLPGDDLVVAVVERADSLDWKEFAAVCRERIDLARGGRDQANESVTLSLTNMQAFGIRDAVAVVVPPGIATVFLGEPYNGLDPRSKDVKLVRCANLGITFDHRLVNGVGAANFQNEIKSNVENIREFIKP